MKFRTTIGTMWLPGPIYEILPYAYVVVGVMFISGTLYIGPNAPGTPLYIGCGLISILYGARVFSMRYAHQRRNPGSATADVA